MANAIYFSNVAQATTLSGSISAGATTFTVGATTGFPGSFPYVLALDYGAATEELVLVSAAAGTNLTATRAYGGTSAQSHSLGAVVRHVYDATEATAYRTHEAATTGVHGVAGTVVGTSDSQTLSNKTLTAPTVNNGTYASGGSLAGTFTGTPTFSQAVTFSGNPVFSAAPNFSGTPTFAAASFSGTVNHTGAIQSTQSASGNVSMAAIVTADTFDRFRVYASGLHEWGSGALARDVNLYRSSADVLKTDDKILSERASAGGDGYAVKVVGDANDRLLITTDSTGAVVKWGNGTLTPDVNLYRSAADTLKTDDSLVVGGTLSDSATGMVFKPYQVGTTNFNMVSVAQLDVAVTFPIAFASAPRVTATLRGLPSNSSSLIVRTSAVTTTGMTLRVNDTGGTSRTVNIDVDWIAVSP